MSDDRIVKIVDPAEVEAERKRMASLPKWARERIDRLERENDGLNRALIPLVSSENAGSPYSIDLLDPQGRCWDRRLPAHLMNLLIRLDGGDVGAPATRHVMSFRLATPFSQPGNEKPGEKRWVRVAVEDSLLILPCSSNSVYLGIRP